MSALDRDIALLGSVRPFNLLEREAVRLVAFAADKLRLREGDTLFRKDDATNGAALITHGVIALDPEDGVMSGRRMVGRGALIGELALLIPTKHPAQAIARETAEALLVSRPLFKRVLDEFPESAVVIHQAYAKELQSLAAQTARVGRMLDAIG